MSGLFSNLADSFSRLSAAVGDVATGGAFRTGVEAMTGLFGKMAEALNEINKTDIEKIDEIRKSLGMPTISRDDDVSEPIEKSVESLRKVVKPGREASMVFEELETSLTGFEKAKSFLNIFEGSSFNRFTMGIKFLAGINVRQSRKQVQNLKEELDNISELTVAEAGEAFGQDPFSAFAGLDMIDAFAPIDLQPRGLLPSNEDIAKGLQVFTDDLAEQVESIEKSKLERAFESFLEFEQLFQDQLVGGFMNSFNEIISLQKANLDQRVDNELKALRKTDKFRNASMEQRQTMEDDVRAKFAKDQKRIFELQKAMSISQVIIDTATSINKLMAAARATMNPAVIAAARGMSGVMGAFSVAQIATISKQQAPAFARGGSFVTGGKQMIMVGDNPGGRERVDITPLSSPDFGDAGGSGSINVNIMGNVIGTQEFVRDNLLPEIENSIKRNLA